MNIAAEQSRIDFEAHVASVVGLTTAEVSLHWTGQGYADASALEPFWRLWTTAQQAFARHQRASVDYGSLDPVQRLALCRGETPPNARNEGIDELVKVLNPYVGACLTISQSAEALYDAGYRKQVAP